MKFYGMQSYPLLYMLSVYGCFFTLTAELSSCNGDHLAHKAQTIYYLALYKESLLTPGLYDIQTTRELVHSFSQPAIRSIPQQPMQKFFPIHSTWLTPGVEAH